MSEKEHVCPKCRKSDGLGWIRKWDVQKSNLGPPMHVECAVEEIANDIREAEKALN